MHQRNSQLCTRHFPLYINAKTRETWPHRYIWQLPGACLLQQVEAHITALNCHAADLSERCLQLINLVGELIDHLLQFGGRLEIVIVHRGLHLIFGRLKPVAQRRQS